VRGFEDSKGEDIFCDSIENKGQCISQTQQDTQATEVAIKIAIYNGFSVITSLVLQGKIK
jgi:hypothetical protein